MHKARSPSLRRIVLSSKVEHSSRSTFCTMVSCRVQKVVQRRCNSRPNLLGTILPRLVQTSLMPPKHFLKQNLCTRLACQPLSNALSQQPCLHVLALTLDLVFLVLIQLGHLLVPSLVSRSKAILSIRGSNRNRDSASKGIESRRTNSQPRCAPRRLGPRRCARRHLRMRVQADLGRGVRRCRRP